MLPCEAKLKTFLVIRLQFYLSIDDKPAAGRLILLGQEEADYFSIRRSEKGVLGKGLGHQNNNKSGRRF